MSRFTALCAALLLIALATAAEPVRAQQTIEIRGERGNAAIVKALQTKIDIDVLNLSLKEFLQNLAKDYGIVIRLDRSGFKRAGIAASIPITASFKQVPLELALKQILRPLKLRHRVADGVVVIEDLGLPLDAAHPPGMGPVGPQPVQVIIERVAAPVPAPRVAAARLVRQNNDSIIRQQLRLVLQVELRFLKSVCAPTAEQFRQIKHEAIQQIVGQVGDHRNENVNTALNGARRSMEEKLAELVRSHLSAEQASHYSSEIKSRAENVRQTCARNLVVAIDEELSLTESQRQKLCAELAENWNDSWTTTVVLSSMNNFRFLPNIPDELVVPHLDPTQRALWASVSKQGNIVWGGAAAAFLGAGPPTRDDEE